MILIYTSTIVAWLDQAPAHDGLAREVMNQALTENEVTVSVFVLGELAAGRRTAELWYAASTGRADDSGIADKRMMVMESGLASSRPPRI